MVFFSKQDAIFLALAAAGVAISVSWVRRRRGCKQSLEVRELSAVPKDEIPECLRPEFFFDFKAHPFDHAELITAAHDVVDVLGSIHKYTVAWLLKHSRARATEPSCVNRKLPVSVRTVGKIPPLHLEADSGTVFEPEKFIGDIDEGKAESDSRVGLHLCGDCKVLGGTFDLRAGGIYLGAGAVVDHGVHIAGPAIIGARTHLRPGAYVRGDVIVGNGAVLRGELKNTVIMDDAELAHPGYAGDSIIGWKGHFGCQSLTANLGLFGATLSLTPPGSSVRYSFGRRKVGIVLGDCSQLGCSTVTDPGTFIGPRTHVYPLTRLAAGVYGPDEIIKNQPEKSGAILRAAVRPK